MAFLRRATVAAALSLLLLVACSDSKKPAASTTTTTSSASSASSSSQALPNGFLVIPTPAGVDPELFGQNLSVTTTRTGRPVVAFSVLFEDAVQSQVLTATYDDATGEFKTPVKVAGASVSGKSQSVSIARDTPGSTLLVAWDDGPNVLLARSTDDGATWSTTVVADGSDPAHSGHSPSVVAAAGKVAIAYVDGNGLPAVATGAVGGPFTIAEMPDAGGSPRATPPAVAASADGGFAFAYVVSPAAGGAAIAYLPAGSTTPVIAIGSNGMQDDTASAGLAFGVDGPIVAATICRTANEPDACTWVASSTDNGHTFAAPVSVPADGSDAGGIATRIAADSAGGAALAYTPSSDASGARSARCGRPKVATSSDLSTWRTCSPDQTNTLSMVPGVPALGVGPDESIVLAFQQMSESAKAPTGVIVVIYPPLSAGSISP
jgi:hypothetical protein